MQIDRRVLLTGAALLPIAGMSPRLALAEEESASTANADYTLRIATGLAELSPDHIVSTTLYNGQFPGPLLRFKEGQRAVVDVHNDTDVPELVHWHGQTIPSDLDGAAEEGTPYIPPRGMRRIAFVPKPAGFRFYHTHVVAGGDLNRGTYTGQLGPAYIEPKHEPGAYDREVFPVLKELMPAFSRGGDMAMDVLAGEPIKELEELGKRADEEAKEKTKGYELGYDLFSINGKMLGSGEPIRVKPGERVMFHILNGSAGEILSLALPGHLFKVVALDGNPVPTPRDVPILWFGTAERISAIVEMNHPGVWVMGDLADDDRKRGAFSDTGNAQHEIEAAAKIVMGTQRLGDAREFGCAPRLEPYDVGRNQTPQPQTIDMLEPNLEARDVLLDLFDEGQLSRQVGQPRVRLDPLLVDRRRAGGDQPGVDHVVLGAAQMHARIGTNLHRLQNEDGKACRPQMRNHPTFVAASRLDADARDTDFGKPAGKLLPARWIIDNLPAFSATMNRDVELGFGRIDSSRQRDSMRHLR